MHQDRSKNPRKDMAMARRIAQGDRAAFAEFVDLYGPRIQALARRYAASQSDTEDLTQEIFLDLYRAIAGFRGASALSTWVYRVAMNHCLKHSERRRRELQPLDDPEIGTGENVSADPARRAIAGELRDKVQTALSGLTPEHRAVVILHELQELTYGECAEILSVPVGTVKSRLYYAFRALKGSLAGYVLGDTCAPENNAGAALGTAAETIR